MFLVIITNAIVILVGLNRSNNSPALLFSIIIPTITVLKWHPQPVDWRVGDFFSLEAADRHDLCCPLECTVQPWHGHSADKCAHSSSCAELNKGGNSPTIKISTSNLQPGFAPGLTPANGISDMLQVMMHTHFFSSPFARWAQFK